uniref:Polyketide synthase n=1 Tax=Peronospora matthiolae TaxID=2874970 RepID=A0AAV1TGC5_9STRA
MCCRLQNARRHVYVSGYSVELNTTCRVYSEGGHHRGSNSCTVARKPIIGASVMCRTSYDSVGF